MKWKKKERGEDSDYKAPAFSASFYTTISLILLLLPFVSRLALRGPRLPGPAGVTGQFVFFFLGGGGGGKT